MDPSNSVDWVARVVSLAGLGVALVVALTQLSTFWRSRHSTPKLALDATVESIYRRRYLLIVRVRLYNRSFKPNALVRIQAFHVRLPLFLWKIRRTELAVGNLSLAPDAFALAVAPSVPLADLPDLFGSGQLPNSGLWRLPMRLTDAADAELILALHSARVDLTEGRQLVLRLYGIFKDCHHCRVSID